MEALLEKLEAAEAEITPQFQSLRQVVGALKGAIKLASADQADALPMQKALTKLETAAAQVDSPTLATAVTAFAATTQSALDNLAFDFAKDLRDAFAARGETVEGRPPLLSVGLLAFQINMAARKGQWFYGKEALTKPIPLSLNAIIKAYDQQQKRILQRQPNPALLGEMHQAWSDCIGKRKTRPQGGRINLIELLSTITLNRQTNRFWNAPSRSTFKDYERVLFVRDLVLLKESGDISLVVDGTTYIMHLGVSTKSMAGNATKSVWLPDTAVDGQYYSDISFD